MVTSVEMPRVTSVSDARHAEHVLEGLGAMGVAQMQHRMVAVVPILPVLTAMLLLPLLLSIIIVLGCMYHRGVFPLLLYELGVLIPMIYSSKSSPFTITIASSSSFSFVWPAAT